MDQLFASGRIVDVILIFMVLEAIALLGLRRLSGHGLEIADVASLMLPGLFLMLALRAALLGSAWPAIAGWLLAALVAHLADVRRRHKQV